MHHKIFILANLGSHVMPCAYTNFCYHRKKKDNFIPCKLNKRILFDLVFMQHHCYGWISDKDNKNVYDLTSERNAFNFENEIIHDHVFIELINQMKKTFQKTNRSCSFGLYENLKLVITVVYKTWTKPQKRRTILPLQ